MIQELKEAAVKLYEEKEAEFGTEVFINIERDVLLGVVDEHWMDHIDAMDQLKRGISIRGYAQRDPVIEYKFEGNQMFEEIINSNGYISGTLQGMIK